MPRTTLPWNLAFGFDEFPRPGGFPAIWMLGYLRRFFFVHTPLNGTPRPSPPNMFVLCTWLVCLDRQSWARVPPKVLLVHGLNGTSSMSREPDGQVITQLVSDHKIAIGLLTAEAHFHGGTSISILSSDPSF